MIYIWLGILTVAVVYLWLRKPKILKVDGFTIDVKNNRLLVKNEKGEIIFNTGK